MPTGRPWEKYAQAPQGPPAQPSPQFPGIIQGRPDAPDPAEQERLRMEQERLRLAQGADARDATKDAQAIAKQAQELGKADNAQADAIASITGVIDKMDQIYADAVDNGGWGETGATGAILRPIPGSAAYNLAENLKTIDANFAFNALQKMRDNSPTGGALGQVSERELELLRSSVANLNPNQSQDQFIRNLSEAKRAYIEMLRRIDPEKAESYLGAAGARENPDGSISYDERGAAAMQGGDSPPPDDNIMFKGVPLLEGDYSLSSITRGIGAGFGDIVQGLGDIVGIGANPVGQAMFGPGYDAGQVVRQATGLPDSDNQTVSTINRFGTAALTGSLAARGMATLASPGTTQNVLNVLGRTPVRDAAAGMGAGAGSEAGRASGVPGGEVMGALAGGIGGYGAASGVNALAGAVRGTPNAMGQAAARQGVDMLPADAGGPVARAVTTGTKASPLSVGPVVKAAQRGQGQMREAARRAAETQGDIPTADVAGQSIRAAAGRFTQETSARGARLYDRAGEAAKGVKIKPLQTVAKLDEQIARAKANPAAPEGLAQSLESFKAKIADGVSVAALRDARTMLSQGVYDGKLRSGAESAMWKKILGNLSSDIELGLQSAGKGSAAAMFKRADAFWRDRVEHIDQVLQPLVGKDGVKSGEDVVKAVETMARGGQGGNARLSRLLGNMTDEEAGQVRAVAIDRMGKANPGAQTAEGDAFSAATFLTNWNKMTPQAKASLFSGKELRRDLDDIAKLAEGMKAGQSMANFSNTGLAIGSNVMVGTAAALSHPVLALIGGSAQFLTGKLMASPSFARLLARTAKMPPEQASRTFGQQVGVIAGREPLLAGDLQKLMGAVNDNAATLTGAAAEDQQAQQ